VQPNNYTFFFENAATPDGQWLVGIVMPRDSQTNTTRPSFLALLNVNTGAIQTIAQLRSPQSAVLGVSADDTWVVWSEADDPPGYFDWTMWAYNRQSGQVTLLAQATQVNGKPVVGPAPVPIVDQGHLLWTQVIGPVSASDTSNEVVRLEDLATGTTTTVATGIYITMLAWPWAGWIQPVPGGDSYVALKNLVTRQTARLNQSPPVAVQMYGTSLIYADSASVNLVRDFTTGTTNAETVFSSATDTGQTTDTPQFPSLNDRLVGWTAFNSTQVFDRAEQRLVTLPSPNGPATVWLPGRLLVWLAPESKAQQDQDRQAGLVSASTIEVVDTSALPVLPAH
jgi:hypothetical protein